VSDLNTLNGPDWAESIPLLLSGRSYAERVEWAGTGALLLAHCYTRYLGDLNGGQLLQRCLVQSFGPDFKAVAFSRFPEIEDLETFRTTYRRSLDRAGSRLADVEDVVAEAAVAFRLNIQLSIEVGSVCLGSPA
jgi:heme oxygenase